MIVSCPECNGKVSDTVPGCPHCGFQMKPITKSGPVFSGPQPSSDRIPCPYCGESILPAATVCPYCKGHVIGGKPAPHHQAQQPMVIVQQQQQQQQEKPKTSCLTWAVLIFFIILGLMCVAGGLTK